MPQACLAVNDSDRFECRPTLLSYENRGNCKITSLVQQGEELMIPSAHMEGKLLFPLNDTERYLRKLEDNDQIVFRYVDLEGNLVGYPWNPNGSIDNIAGICNPEGNVLGMMPHPERTFFSWQHPDWTRRPGPWLDASEGDGRVFFESILTYIENRF